MTALSYIYFLKPVGMPGPIKIGYSRSPIARLLAYTAWSPFRLELLATAEGDKVVERKLHNCFADIHSHCEWFHVHERLMDVIAAVKAGSSIADIVDLNAPRGNCLAKVQMETRVRNGTASKTKPRLISPIREDRAA